MRVAGSRPQEPVGQVSRGLGARAPRAWGPAHQGPGAFSPQKPPKPLKLRGPGGKRSRDTPPTPPPAFWGCKGERKRVFTLSAFGNHPTRPPRSADRSLAWTEPSALMATITIRCAPFVISSPQCLNRKP